MRLAINATTVSKLHNGITTFVDGIVQYLGSHGHELLVYTSAERYANLAGVTLRRTPEALAFNGSAANNFRRFAWTQAVLPSRLKRDRVDLFFSPVEGLLHSPVPQVVAVHDLIPLFYPVECPRLHHYYKRVLPYILKGSARAVVPSQHTKSDLIDRYNLPEDKVSVVYYGLRAELFDADADSRPACLEAARFFLFVGSFAPRKNLETVVRAFATIHAEVPERLVVVAYPDERQQTIRELAKSLNVLDKLAFCSGLSNSELAYLYRHATGLLLLSEYEGFGYPPLEAMATRTPAIVSDSTSLAEVVGDAGITGACRDFEAAAAAMRRLSREQLYRELLGKTGEARARQFTWLNTAKQLSDALVTACS
jgi:glycosyltransferase involved in cell wall biosynthesis